MTDPDAEQALLAGRYRLTETLGRGGMGRVWSARDETLGREVAVKELRVPGHVDDEERDNLCARMTREARAAARVDHPGVVTIFDIVVEDGRPWIVMEHVRGRSLAQELEKDGPLPARQVAEMGLRLLAALEAAHAAGVLHRDVKPANVLLARNGRVVLSDFGIASVEDSATLTQAGALVGSPEYLSPEQVDGKPPSPASDLWSLGVTLYEAVEGRTPFRRASHAATLAAVAAGAVPESLHADTLGPALRALLTKDPRQRADIGRARELLTEAAETAPVTVGSNRGCMPGRAGAPLRRHEVHIGAQRGGVRGSGSASRHVVEHHAGDGAARGSTDETFLNAKVAPHTRTRRDSHGTAAFGARYRHWPRWWHRYQGTVLVLAALVTAAGSRWLAAWGSWTGMYTIVLLGLALTVWLFLPHRRVRREIPAAMLCGVVAGGVMQWRSVHPNPLLVLAVVGGCVVLGPAVERWVLRRVKRARRRPVLGFSLPVPDGWSCTDSDNGLAVSDPDRLVSVTVSVDRGIVMPPEESVVHREHDSVATTGRDRMKSEDYRRLHLGRVDHRVGDAAQWEYVWRGPDGTAYHGKDFVVRTPFGVRYWMTVRSREDLWGTAGAYYDHAIDHLSIVT